MSDNHEVSREDINRVSAGLFEWMTIPQLDQTISDLRQMMLTMPDEAKGHRERTFKAWREAWVLSQFPIARNATRLKLVPEGGQRT